MALRTHVHKNAPLLLAGLLYNHFTRRIFTRLVLGIAEFRLCVK